MSCELQNTKYESRVTSNERRGFTLIELVVAIALLAMVIFFAGSVFKAAIGSYRIATAQAEVMQKLRAITGQLNSDFKGLRKDAPLFIWFQLDPNDYTRRMDQIMFFAAGDFQSTRLYDGTPKIPSNTGAPIASNVARIQYGQAKVVSPVYGGTYGPSEINETDIDRFHHLDHRVLARNQHLLTNAPGIVQWPAYTDNILTSFDWPNNSAFEHDSISLSEWQALATLPANIDLIITVCFRYVSDLVNNRPQVDFKNNSGLQNLLTEGVGNMSIQWAYSPNPTLLKPPGTIYWWPSIDPDGDGFVDDSDFGSMTFSLFCVCFNVAQPSVGFLPLDAKGVYVTGLHFPDTFYPTALKFTFTLYDSKGVFKDGQTFTHIVYLGD